MGSLKVFAVATLCKKPLILCYLVNKTIVNNKARRCLGFNKVNEDDPNEVIKILLVCSIVI